MGPIPWLCHVLCHSRSADGRYESRTIEMQLMAFRKDDAQIQAASKATALGYTPTSIQVVPHRKATGVGPRTLPQQHPLLPVAQVPYDAAVEAQEAETKPAEDDRDILEDLRVFSLANLRPMYGPEVSSDSSP